MTAATDYQGTARPVCARLPSTDSSPRARTDNRAAGPSFLGSTSSMQGIPNCFGSSSTSRGRRRRREEVAGPRGLLTWL